MGALNRVSVLTIYLLSALLALPGCVNPFQPADPPPPTGIGVVPNFTTPEKLLITIEDAITAKSDGEQAYGEVLADSTSAATPFGFYAVPDPSVLAAWRQTSSRDPYAPGDVRHEKLFFPDLMQVLESFEYAFVFAVDNNTLLDDIGTDTAVLNRYYVLQATSADGRIQEVIAVGYVFLTMRKYNGRWWLTRWDDVVDPNIGVNPANPYNRTMGARRLDL